MLVLSRKNREAVAIGGSGGLDRLLRVTVLEISGNSVRLGFDGDRDIPIHRWEVWERILAEGETDNRLAGPADPVA